MEVLNQRRPDWNCIVGSKANAFIGYYLRMELLSLHDEADRLLREMKAFFLPMAEVTGTLWEHRDSRARSLETRHLLDERGFYTINRR